MTRLLAGIACLMLVFAAQAAEQKTSPVEKVIELLEDLKGKVKADLDAEGKAMTEYLEYCDFEAKDTEYAIKTGTREIADQEAVITDCSAKVEGYESEISSLSSEIASKETEVTEAKEIRAEERKDFMGAEKDILTTIDELSRGQVTIKKGGSSFLQEPGKLKILTTVMDKIVSAEWLDAGSKKRITKFLQSTAAAGDGDELSLKAEMAQPQAKVDSYSDHSGGILDTLADMQEKAEASLSELRKKEMKSAHTSSMTVMGLEDSITLLKKQLSDATGRKASTSEEAGKAKGEVAGMTKSLAADKEYLTSLNTECQEKSSEWDARKESAAGELEAIAKAKEILSSGVKAAFVQRSSHPYGESSHKAQKRTKVSTLLRDIAKKFHSYALMEMASMAQVDPFAKVKGLIEDMVAKLLNEANEEASHKAFCDEELAKSSKTKEEKMASMDEFSSRMDKASSGIATLTEQVKVLQSEVADIDAAQRESAKVRKEEKENYLKASGDFKASAEAVAQAIQVLKDYYEGAALVQVNANNKKAAVVSADKQPSFGSARSDSGGSIISVLETAEADFTKLLAEAETAENQAVAAFRKLADEDELAKVAKLSSVKGRQSEIKSLEVSLGHYKDDHATANKEFDAVMDYLDKLKPQCETKVMSYEERKARREAEIEGLKEALAILDGDGIAFVQEKQFLRPIQKA